MQYLKLACRKVNRLVQTAVTILVLERLTAGWKSTCIWKVLRLPNSIKFFRDVLRSSSKYRTGTTHPRCTTPLSFSPSNNNFKISTQKQPSKHKFNKIQNWTQTFSSLGLLNSSTPHHTWLTHFHALYLASSLPLPERRAGTAWEPNSSKFSFSLPVIKYVPPSTSVSHSLTFNNLQKPISKSCPSNFFSYKLWIQNWLRHWNEFNAVRITFTSTLLEQFPTFSGVCKLIVVDTLHFYTFQIPNNGGRQKWT